MGLRETWPMHRPYTEVEEAFASAMRGLYREGRNEFDVPWESMGVRESFGKTQGRADYRKTKREAYTKRKSSRPHLYSQA